MRELIISFILVTTFSVTLNKPAQPQVQAQESIKTTQKAPQKAVKKKEVKDVTPKRKPPVEAPRVVKPNNTGSGGNITSIIRKWATVHGIDHARAIRIAGCESTFNPSAVNRNYYAGGGNPTGLYQYLPETWNRISSRSPYGTQPWSKVTDGSLNAKITMWAWANGYAGEWECK